MGCPGCGGETAVGVLCQACAARVAPCAGLIPDHIRTTEPPKPVAAWLIDGFGVAHPLGRGRTVVGRRPPANLQIYNASVSREHAELTSGEDGWQLRDLGSRNGSQIDGDRTQGSCRLRDRATVRIGEVALLFVGEPVGMPLHQAPSIATVQGGSAPVRYLLAAETVELCLIGSAGPDGADAGGALLHRAPGAATWSEQSLPPLEFQLLASLCKSALAEAGSPSQIRGCVATRQLARELPFQSRYANEENVRQVVRRLRVTLTSLAAADLVEAAPGRGYYLRWPVRVA